MKDFLLKLCLFLLGFLLLDFGVSSGIAHFYEKSSLSPLASIVREEPEVVFLGSSRFRHGIDTRELEDGHGIPSFNLGANAHGLEYAVGLAAVILEYYRPRLFVLEVMDLYKTENQLASLEPFFRYTGADHVLDRLPWKVRLRYRFVRSMRFNSQLLRILPRIGKDPEKDVAGYYPLEGTKPEFAAIRSRRRSERAKRYRESGGPVEDVAGSEGILLSRRGERELLESFVHRAKAAGVEVLFVKTPRIGYHPDPSREVYGAIAKALEVDFLDYSFGGESFVDFPDDHFWDDGDHLNSTGAAAFSGRLAGKLRQRLVEAK